jgi:DNA repair protein RecN (Recombination protein N)
MLIYLRIRDLALIEDASIEPATGLVAFTGETGAGKSIILGGLDLVIGRRAALDQVRAGAPEAVVEALFDISERQDVRTLLAAEGIEVDEPELLVRRRIAARGSRADVNDNLVTVATLNRLGALLVDIVGQHESQTLLSASAQLDLLDEAGELAGLRGEVEAAWDEASRLHREFAQLRAEDRDRAQRAGYLRFQLEEIRAAQLDPAEEADLAAERQRLRHADELSNAAAEALATLYEAENSAGALVARAEAAIATIVALDANTDLPVAGLQEARWGIEEMGRALQVYHDAVQSDPTRQEAVEARLAEIDVLRRKYGDTVADVLERAEQAAKELASIENRDEELTRLADAARAAVRSYDQVAQRLGAARRVAAASLQSRITEELQELGMEGRASSPGCRPGNATAARGCLRAPRAGATRV